jgi:retrograde regulation protein 2
MLKVNETYGGKIFGLSKRRRSQFPAIVTVVEALVKAVPTIKQVSFCSGGNREGVLYMKLPLDIRESIPLPFLPGGSDRIANDSVEGVIDIISSALPSTCPRDKFTRELQHFMVRTTWIDMGDTDDSNTTKALHNPISGLIAGLPGLTHEISAIIALTMCARWGSDIGPIDQPLYNSLRQLVGPTLSFWCEYIGAILRLLATLAPGYAASNASLAKSISFVLNLFPKLKNISNTNDRFDGRQVEKGLGKSGKKGGVKLQITVKAAALDGLGPDSLTDLFKKVGDDDHRLQVTLA